ncbi:hypothetical protein WKI68_37910 [Streptomyces sp. MS1.HAVA.3]|uniref:Uncharacterized protein n=1 Tax=Streptomyces caledonius TaxID=3134107 RepID=A0ABU8UD84_9ACTN
MPGAQDVNQAASLAYFHTCEADEVAPQPPYWPKWRHYTRLFRGLYQGLDTVFDSDQPWTLFPVPELSTVVAGFNSSMAYSHRPEEQYGFIGRDQAAWFAEAMRRYEEEGWLRIGALRHPLTDGRRPGDAVGGPGGLKDADTFARLAAPRLHLLLHGPTGGPRTLAADPSRTQLAGAAGDLPLFGSAAPPGSSCSGSPRTASPAGTTGSRPRASASPAHGGRPAGSSPSPNCRPSSPSSAPRAGSPWRIRPPRSPSG